MFRYLFHLFPKCFETVASKRKFAAILQLIDFQLLKIFTIMNNGKQTQNIGLAQRMGNGFGKFTRQGSVWRWEFEWLDGNRTQHGYDSGKLPNTNKELWERLETSFAKRILTTTKKKGLHAGKMYAELVRGFRVYLVDGQDKTKDILLFTVSFSQKYTEDNIKYMYANFSLTPEAVASLERGNLVYINELFAVWQLEIQNHYRSANTTAKDLLAQLNKQATLSPQATLQARWADLLDELATQQASLADYLKKFALQFVGEKTVQLLLPKKAYEAIMERHLKLLNDLWNKHCKSLLFNLLLNVLPDNTVAPTPSIHVATAVPPTTSQAQKLKEYYDKMTNKK